MLKNVPACITPELMKTMMEMGHADEIIFADGNFPAISVAKKYIRCDGVKIPELLDAVLKFFPLDRFEEKPVAVMELGAGDPNPPNWPHYMSEVQKYEPRITEFEYIERFAFYERAKKAFAVVITGDISRHANILLKKDLMSEYPE
jgi:L-fucose mutarotase